MVEIRMANRQDAAQILEIYAPYILTTAVSFETELPSIEEMERRIESSLQHPWIVCIIDGKIAGYVYASKHREREAYQWTCECSVYLHDDLKGKGVASLLYTLLFRILKAQGFRNVYAGITLPNEASLRLHERCGFIHFASYENIGFKFGRWHTVGWWKLQINDYDLKLPPPFKLRELHPETLADWLAKAAARISAVID